MSQYSKQQEYRFMNKLHTFKSVKVIEHFGSRKKKVGDVLWQIGDDIYILTDIKSTRSPDCYRMYYRQIEKIHEESYNVSCDPISTLAITFKGKHKMLIVTSILPDNMLEHKTTFCKFKSVYLRNTLSGIHRIDFKQYANPLYIMPLSLFIKGVKGWKGN